MNINSIDYYIPDQKVPIKEILDKYEDKDLPKELGDRAEVQFFFERFIGLSEVRINNDLDETGFIRKSFQSLNLDLSEIKLIIDFSCSPFFNFKNMGHYIKTEYSLINADVLNISGALCANLDIALVYASKLYQRHTNNKILFCGGTKIPDPKRLAGSFSIMGDSFGYLITDFIDDQFELIDFEITTVSGLYKEQESENQSIIMTDMHLKCLSVLFNRHNKDNIKQILIPNGFPLLITQSLQQVGFDKEKIYIKNITKGHFAYMDSLINLKDFIMENPDFKGEILVIGISYSGTIVASIYNIK